MGRSFLLLLVFTLHGLISFAQDSLTIGFREAVDLALKKNVSIRQEKNNLRARLADRRQAKALYAPGAGASATAQRLNGQQFDQVTGQVFRDNTELGNLSVGARYIIFDGLNRKYTNQRTQSLLESQQYLVNRTEQEIIYTVANQFLQILLDNELLRISEQNLEVQQTTLEQIRGFVEAGTRPLSDQLDQEATVSKIDVQVIRARNDLRFDKALLKQTLLLDPDVHIDLDEPVWSFESILVETYDLDKLYETAIRNRPDYKQALARKEAASAGINIARAGHFPTLSFFGSAGTRYSSQLKEIDNPEQTKSFAGQVEDNSQFTYGLELQIPIYSRHATLSEKTRARVAWENAVLAEEELRIFIFNEVQNAYLNFQAAKDEYYAALKQFEAAEASFTIQKERYEVGVGDLVELSRATGFFVDASASRAQAQYTLLFQKVIMDYFTGLLVKEEI